jgi:hypothetical protein
MDEEYNLIDDNDESLSFDHSGTDSGEFDDEHDFKDEDLALGFVRYVGRETGGYNVYEFIFTIYIDTFFGDGFEYKPAGISNGLEPFPNYVQKVVRVKTKLLFDLIQDSGCFSMQDAMDGIVSIAWENIDDYDKYPDEGRLYLRFGDSYEEVERKLAIKHIILEL